MSEVEAIARQIDRPVWAVSGALRDQHSELPLASTLEPATFWPLINLLPFRDHMTDALVLRRYCYRGESAMAAYVDDLLATGLFERVGERLVPTEQLTPLVEEVNAAIDTVSANLWVEHEERAMAISKMARDVLDAAVDRDGMVALAQNQVEANDPYHRLWQRLTSLRLVRNEAHVAAWTTAALSAADVEVLTSAWAGTPIQGEITHSENLSSLGYIEDGSVTEAGLAARQRIEDTTDDGVRPAFDAIDGSTFLELLTGLPPWS